VEGLKGGREKSGRGDYRRSSAKEVSRGEEEEQELLNHQRRWGTPKSANPGG